MDQHFIPVTDTAAVEDLFASSADHPVVVFKHDPSCPISATAFREMTRLPNEIAIIDVEHDQDVASAVTQRTGIRHESPQVIVLRNGAATWSASQFDITTDAVLAATHAEIGAR